MTTYLDRIEWSRPDLDPIDSLAYGVPMKLSTALDR